MDIEEIERNHLSCIMFCRFRHNLQRYIGVDMEGDKDNRRSTTGYVFTMGGTAVSWISKLQQAVALSTMKAKYVAATEVSKEMIWL